jgi:DNA invertase Pin-like site-specific DNA recombinase
VSETPTAVYIRASTGEQNEDHQRNSIGDWLESNGTNWSDVTQFADTASGANDDREQFQELLSRIKNEEFDRVVTWEISRISRRGATLQEFFDACEQTDTTVIITDGAISRVDPDGTNRFVADVIGMVYQQERRQLIRRIESGIDRAQREGKWLGQVPAGFIRDDDGYLQPNLNPDHEAGEAGYLELRSVLEDIDNGESYRSAAQGLPVTRQTLSAIDNDPDRRQWYLEAEACDDRVDEALGDVKMEASDD